MDAIADAVEVPARSETKSGPDIRRTAIGLPMNALGGAHPNAKVSPKINSTDEPDDSGI